VSNTSYYYHQQLRAQQIAAEQAARDAQRAAQRDTASKGGASWGIPGGVDYGGFERVQRNADAGEAAARSMTTGNQAYAMEQAASRDREMGLAENEQRLKYDQLARETNAKYGAVGSMTGALGGLTMPGAPQQQVPGVNLYGANGARIGGSSGPTRQNFFQNLT
jgi:hypothetical protein